jgi:hypothetical protein
MMDTQKIEMLMQEPMILSAIIIPILYIVYTHFTSKNAAIELEASKSKRVVNLSIKKSEGKVVDKIDCGEIENLAEFSNGKLVMCRCWRSKTFPYCDGIYICVYLYLYIYIYIYIYMYINIYIYV